MMTSEIEKILMITLSGGGGHIQATKAKCRQIKEKHPNTEFVFFDTLMETYGARLGKFFVWQWDSALENGDVTYQEWLRISGHPIAEKLFWLPIFFKVLHQCFFNGITKIIDTQIMGTSAIISALRLVKLFKKREVKYEKIITELPSEKATCFFSPIKSLSKKEKPYITVSCAFSPLIEKPVSEQFWQTHCGIPSKEVLVDTPPLRPEFLKLINQPKLNRQLTLKIHTHSDEELKLVQSAAERGYIELENHNPSLHLEVSEQAKVSVIMLGSRPHEKALLSYVSHYIEMAKQYEDQQHLLFVFCRNYDEKPQSLLKRVCDLVQFESHFPQSLSVIPLPFQNDDLIAPLFKRSDMTLTRSGGITSMELFSVCSGHMWIHTESLDNYRNKSAGMPAWEEGNAHLLMQKKGAKFITPDTFFHTSKEYFEQPIASKQRQTLPNFV